MRKIEIKPTRKLFIEDLGLVIGGRKKCHKKDDSVVTSQSIGEEDGVPDWQGMVGQLVAGHEACARTAREAFQRADAADDQPTADLATTRMQAHEKTAWMLRSLLQ